MYVRRKAHEDLIVVFKVGVATPSGRTAVGYIYILKAFPDYCVETVFENDH